jgi:DNA-binding IclR family transcriptional regulator
VVAAVERAIAILDAFRRGDDSLSLAELASRTGFYKSTILRLATTLIALGYLDRSPNGNYVIGPAPIRLASISQRTQHPSDIILPVLRSLVAETDESASYTVRRGATAMCVYRVDSPRLVRDTIQPGDAYPIDTGASGKAIRAFEPPFLEIYALVREHLLAHTAGELTPDFASVASPVFSADGAVRGSISISGSARHFGDDALPRFRRLLLAAAARVTVALGGDDACFSAAAERTALDEQRSSESGSAAL